MCVIRVFIKRRRPADILPLYLQCSLRPSNLDPPPHPAAVVRCPLRALDDVHLSLHLPASSSLHKACLTNSSSQPYSHIIPSRLMAPVVLESPVVNMHSNALSPMSRLQFNGHIHTPPASDHSRNDEDASPLTATGPLPPIQRRNTNSPFPLDPALNDRSEDNGDPTADQNNPPANSELACTNCGTVTTPQWRRGDDGKSICNACGKYHSRPLLALLISAADICASRIHLPREPRGHDDLPPAPRVLRVRS